MFSAGVCSNTGAYLSLNDRQSKMISGTYSKFLFISLTCLSIFTNKSRAQTGSLGDPVVHITFGAGTSTHSGALHAA